jgi:hypothetical protein
MTTLNVDQELALVVAPGSPKVAVDQNLALIVEQRLVPKIIFNRADQLLALIVEIRSSPIVEIVGGAFQDIQGNPIAFGVLEIQLSASEAWVGNKQIDLEKTLVTLDASGNIPPGRLFVYSNDPGVLQPAGSYYSVGVFTATGVRGWKKPHKMTVPATKAVQNINDVLSID